MLRIGGELIADAKSKATQNSKSDFVEKGDIVGRDLLSLLIRANMATDLKESQRMLDDEILARMFIRFCYSCRFLKQRVSRGSNFSFCRS
jgi:hypothetical protein